MLKQYNSVDNFIVRPLGRYDAILNKRNLLNTKSNISGIFFIVNAVIRGEILQFIGRATFHTASTVLIHFTQYPLKPKVSIEDCVSLTKLKQYTTHV